MLKFITSLTFFLFGILAKGQVTETRSITDFNKLEVKNATVIYTESNLSSLKIDSEFNDAPETVITEISNGTLKIKGVNAGEKTIVYVSGKATEFKLGAKAQLTATNLITANVAEITLHSGAVFNGCIKAQQTVVVAGKNARYKGAIETAEFTAQLSSNAQAIFCGSANVAKINAQGSVLCNARNLLANTLKVTADGNSKITVYSDKQIAIDVVDNARVIYNGLPKHVSFNASASAVQRCKSDQVVTYNY